MLLTGITSCTRLDVTVHLHVSLNTCIMSAQGSIYFIYFTFLEKKPNKQNKAFISWRISVKALSLMKQLNKTMIVYLDFYSKWKQQQGNFEMFKSCLFFCIYMLNYTRISLWWIQTVAHFWSNRKSDFTKPRVIGWDIKYNLLLYDMRIFKYYIAFAIIRWKYTINHPKEIIQGQLVIIKNKSLQNPLIAFEHWSV